MGRLPGNGNRAEARSLGDNVVSGARVRRRPQARSPCLRVPFCMMPEMPQKFTSRHLAYLNIFRNSIQNKVAGERVHFSKF